MEERRTICVLHEERLARLEERLDGLDKKFDKLISHFDIYAERMERRVSALEKWRAWMTGIAIGVSALFGAIAALLKVGVLHIG
jgi:hypothetical protein